MTGLAAVFATALAMTALVVLMAHGAARLRKVRVSERAARDTRRDVRR